MRTVIATKKFDKSYLAFSSRNAVLKASIDEALRLLAEDVFSPKLRAHRLKGSLLGFQACSCGYDCRIVFQVEHDVATNEEYILLVDIGTHEDVY